MDHLNLSIKKGEVFGLLGPNGAGKSTTILMMLGLTEPTSGQAKVLGLDSTRDGLRVKKSIGYLPEDVGFYEDYSGLENLLYTAELSGLSRVLARAKALDLMQRVGLGDATQKLVSKYSRGMRQRLGLADVLIKDPQIIILDEPTLGLDPQGVDELLALIRRLSREEGLTVLLSSHHLRQVQEICDRVGLFVKGKLLAHGNIQDLSSSLFTSEPYVIEAEISTAENPVKHLRVVLQDIDGVLSIDIQGRVLRISCAKNVTADIARVIVSCGVDLYHLSKKEYGLDDIYRHYFNDSNDLP
ncbi:MAG TPA: ABC transporter ATP-binding protein [Chryseolinea sp.]